MIYGEWTHYIIGISILLTVFIAAKMCKLLTVDFTDKNQILG